MSCTVRRCLFCSVLFIQSCESQFSSIPRSLHVSSLPQNGIVQFFSRIPRLVSPDAQFSDLFSSFASASASTAQSASPSQSQEYVVSTTLIAVALSVVVLFWLLLLLLFKALGPGRLCECGADVGLAGNAVQKPDLVALHAAHPLSAVRRYEQQQQQQQQQQQIYNHGGMDVETAIDIDTRVTDTTSAVMNAHEQAAWVRKVETIEWRVRNVRIAAAFFAVLLVASSVLMVLFGLRELRSVTTQVQSTAAGLGDAFGRAAAGTENFVERGVLAVRGRDELVGNLADGARLLCPNCDAQGGVLVTDPNGYGSKLVAFGHMANTLSASLEHLGDFGLSKALKLQEALEAISAGLHALSDDVDGYAWFYPSAIALLSILDAVALVYLIGIVAAARERSSKAFQRVQTWALLPLFVLLIVATTVVCSFFSIVTVMNADFCTGSGSGPRVSAIAGTSVGSPDDSVAAILDATLYPTDPAYTAVAHFTQGCRQQGGMGGAADPLGDMHLLTTKIDAATAAQGDFIRQVMAHDATALGDALGIGPPDLLTVLGKISDLDESLSALVSQTANATEALDCPALNGAYADVAYSGVCGAGSRALAWMLACLGAVVLSGLAIVTLRSSWRDVVDYVDPAEAQLKGVGRGGYDDDNSIYDEGVEVLEEEFRASCDDDDDIYDDGDDRYDSRPYYR